MADTSLDQAAGMRGRPSAQRRRMADTSLDQAALDQAALDQTALDLTAARRRPTISMEAAHG
ncbi:MAG TPA: hypothetical protein VGP05_23125 [Pseudonocardia sp.]|nr:hypothetical protein [Pseudonocardia sp.]